MERNGNKRERQRKKSGSRPGRWGRRNQPGDGETDELFASTMEDSLWEEAFELACRRKKLKTRRELCER